MAFKEPNIESKQRINITKYTKDVIENDMVIFDIPKLSTFVNELIDYHIKYYETESISCQIDQKKASYKKSMKNLGLSPEQLEHLTDALIKTEQDKILQVIRKQYSAKEVSFTCRINNENLERLTDCSYGDSFYFDDRLGKYLKYLLERYAELPYSKRETIILHQRINLIKNAITCNKQLRITTAYNEERRVFPLKIATDSLTTANYLIGYQISPHDNNAEKLSCTYRISNLKNIWLETYQLPPLTEKEITDFEEKQKEVGFQFLFAEKSQIRVRLTKEGVMMYRKMFHMRPAYHDIEDGSVYVFDCSEAQIRLYFYKFGKEAEILSPPRLREIFRKDYIEASKIYDSPC